LSLLRLLLAMSLLAARLACAGETAQTITAADLKDEPFVDARTIVNLPVGTAVEILKHQGGWIQVKPAADSAGWIRMLSVKLAGASAGKGESGLAELWNVGRSGRSGNTGVTVATGVRGLGAEDLKNARPDTGAVKKLDGLVVSKPDAEKFAGGGSLKKQSIDYMVSSGSTGQNAAGSGPGAPGGLVK
jgi:hypothetical protein